MAYLHRGVLVCRILWIGWGYILRRRAYFYNQNDGTFISVLILEDEIRKLPVLCLHIFYFLNSSSYGAIYIIGKPFSHRVPCILDRKDWFSSYGDIHVLFLGYAYLW